MNYTFKLGKMSFVVSNEVEVIANDIEFSVENYDIKEGLEVLKAIPAILADIKKVIEEPTSPFESFDDEEEDEVGDSPFDLLNVLFGKPKMENPLEAILKEKFGEAEKFENPLEAFINAKLAEKKNIPSGHPLTSIFDVLANANKKEDK